jgi:hypothetical protein
LKVYSAKGVDGDVLYISKPRKMDPYATVIELRLDGPPVVTQSTPTIKAGPDGTLTLKAADAEIHGSTAQYEQGHERDNIGFWTNRSDYVTWTCEIPRAGRYRVAVTYACPSENADSRYTVGPDEGERVSGVVKATGSWGKFQEEEIGEIALPAGKQTMAVRILEMPRGAAMNLQAVRLIPAR